MINEVRPINRNMKDIMSKYLYIQNLIKNVKGIAICFVNFKEAFNTF